jgi:hypothetical protein
MAANPSADILREIQQKEFDMRNIKKIFTLTLKIVLLTVLYGICFMVGSRLLGPVIPRTPGMEAAALLAMPLVCLVDTLVLTLVILRSNWSGWRLMLATAVTYYGVQTFMAQIESAYFGPLLGITPAMLPGLFLSSLPIILIFIPLAVLLLGKARPASPEDGLAEDPSDSLRLSMPAIQWAWKLAVIAVLYLVLYYGFGFFVAWQNPHLAAMYGNGINKVIFDYSKLIPIQLGRGILWALFALPVIRSSKGSPWQIALIVGLYLALPMNISHALPNPFMPDPSVRLSHFIETATSNFIFGILLTRLILYRPSTAHSHSFAGQTAKSA